jgi:hypothetical protein
MGATTQSLAEAMNVQPGNMLVVETQDPRSVVDAVVVNATEGTRFDNDLDLVVISDALGHLREYAGEVGRPGAPQIHRARVVSLIGGLLEALGDGKLIVTRVGEDG